MTATCGSSPSGPCASWSDTVEDAYRGAGAIAARPPPGDADAQTVLLARFGRSA